MASHRGFGRGLIWSLIAVLIAVSFKWFEGGDAGKGGSEPTLVWVRGADSARLDPADIDDTESVKVVNCLFEGLTQFVPGSTDVEPCLAEAWEISDDGLEYRFKLRTGVRFHDGSLLTPEVAVESFRRQMDRSHRFHFPEGNYPYWDAMYSVVESVRPDGPEHLIFRLTERHAPFLASLAVFPAAILSVEALESRGFGFGQRPVGTGPYRFVEWIPKDRIVLRRWDGYWGAAPKLERVVFKVVPSADTRLLQVQTGDGHGMDGLDTAQISVVLDDPSLKLYRGPGMNIGYLAMNTQIAPMSDVRFRRGVAMAIDKPNIIRSAYQGAAVAAKTPLPPFMLGYHSDLPEVEFDPEAARELVSQVPGFDRPITLNTMSNPRPYMPNPSRVAELIKEDLQRIGLNIRIQVNEWGAHRTALMSGSHDMGMFGWVGDNGDPDNFLWVLFGPDSVRKGAALNVSFFVDDRLTEVLGLGRQVGARAERAGYYREAQEILQAQMPVVPLVHAEDMGVVRSEVEGFVLQPTGDLDFLPVWLRDAP
ncbi:MAG: ABC transporter substrate-binding protein [Verrucomicrobiota bacterium]|jgi:peptide/nickel transport system substrate-binding protein|nr:ABC transporter substrate-binding protein [Verrucomicrobiota bacterium]MDD8045335.1 ABC transporter substrate-binding protein [Verrucomicrobiota bacterium]MDD8049837.1 ABC transporter substrate-binding protein [Verrucomicrobiota bacterium]MDI9383127.1 ABC transporter substrate-binding protein [Verrucomicrobiota bacterium]